MNETDPNLPPDPAPSAPGAPQEPYACGAWLGGFVVALVLGLIGDVFALRLSGPSGSLGAGLIIGLVPGGILALISLRFNRAFAAGMLFGACLVALLGGACGAMLGGRREL